LSREFYFYRKQLYSPESAPNESNMRIHHNCDELQGQRMAVTIGERGDVSMSPHSLGSPRIPEESMSSENRTLLPYQRDRTLGFQFDASRSSHDSDALVSDLKWGTVEEGSSSMELEVSKWWKEQPVASPVTQLSYSPFYYCNIIMDYLFLLSGVVVYLPQLPFFSEGGGIVGTQKTILKGHIGIGPLGHERIQGTRSPRIPMSPCIITISLLLS
jgi:hypothetical protein